MSIVTSSLPFVAPTLNDCLSDLGAGILAQNDAAELNAWVDSHSAPLSTSEEDELWAAEMIRRDAEASRPALPVSVKPSAASRGCFDLVDARGRLLEQGFGRAEMNKRARRLNSAA